MAQLVMRQDAQHLGEFGVATMLDVPHNYARMERVGK